MSHGDRARNRRQRATCAVALAAAALLGASCGTSTSTPAPSASGPSAGGPPASAPASTSGPGQPSGGATVTPGSSASAQPPFDPARVAVALQPYATVSGGPLAITAPRDGTGRLFVASQDGSAWVVHDGTTLRDPLLDLRGRISTGGERGLLGIAVHPRYPADPRIFVDYTDTSGNTVVASYEIDPSNPNRLAPESKKELLHVGQPFANHNGGALAFGPDGYLYVSLGDGGSGGDPMGNGQRLDTTLGKILRIDIDKPSDNRPYGIPADNPFVGNPLAHGEIWLYGLRNPWRMSFDDLTGDLWIGDVGQNAWEEVDVDPAGHGGLDYGWNRMEGRHCYQPSDGCDQTGLTMPVAEYGHDDGCVVIGGVVYRGKADPILDGGYLFADYCSGKVFAIPATATAATTAAAAKPVEVGTVDSGLAAFGEDESGEVYAANLAGQILKVTATAR
jgi:glucose/arabinose dehydrogenase